MNNRLIKKAINLATNRQKHFDSDLKIDPREGKLPSRKRASELIYGVVDKDAKILDIGGEDYYKKYFKNRVVLSFL